MAHQSQPSDHIYNRIPLEQHPPSPGPGSTFQNPHSRFAGQALYQDGSYATSHQSMPSIGGNSEYSASVYALNDTRDNPSLSGHYRDDPNGHDVAMSPMGRSKWMDEKEAAYASPKAKTNHKLKIIAVIVAGALVIIAIIVGVYFALSKKDSKDGNASKGTSSDASTGKNSNSNGNGNDKSGVVLAVTGGDGSEVTLEDGTTFKYSNPHGGHWYYDPNEPFNNGAKAQSWSPALNETFNYGVDRIRGVNVGGWLTIEPVSHPSAPALFEKYATSVPTPVDEYTLHMAVAADTANGGLAQIEEHYKTFITEKDFAEIAGAGLNYVRIPLPYWAIDVRENEPFLPKTAWKYFLKAIGWARKYGLRINLDLHAVPGSQNGWNHSGKLGDVNWLMGPMGLANAQRTLDYIRILAEFIAQPQYRDVITMFGIINEPRESYSGAEQIEAFYAEAYRIIREITGIGQGAWISYHDAFRPRSDWAGFMANADRIMLDDHPYIAFGGQDNRGWGAKVDQVCGWSADVKTSMSAFGMTAAGEFSLAINDCGLWVTGVGDGTRYEGDYKPDPSFPRIGSCTQWTDWTKFDAATKAEMKQFAMASFDALQNFFFWTWKIGDSINSGKVESPAWSYKLGLEQGWMPLDPREANGVCGDTAPFNRSIPHGNGNANLARYPWPPATIRSAGPANRVPTYTATGVVPTLAGATLTVSGVTPTKTIDIGNGWANPQDQAGMMVPVAGCSYLDPWVGTRASVPTPLCPGVRRDIEAHESEPTPPPL
ncbi:glycoside hydrolase family 5 protein [Moniliophthora roreri MCA 2997]|uniref:glucan 1,3-beta-glucosidase n=1 Tax=Moniliophthora roreri (strain MCA 2997) TaxID=1381753 RepID=V2YK16_MONRO|nr:glycoside hydrolase family 5 protein [Moniliophthora roreri MCA 2997]